MRGGVTGCKRPAVIGCRPLLGEATYNVNETAYAVEYG